jgi:predicted DNA-binding protein with PD1-like motif
MDYREVDTDRTFVCSLDNGTDWRGEIEELATEADLDAAWFTGLGAVQDARLLFYDQTDQEYQPVTFDEPLEVAACVGNIALLDGDPFAHTHAVLSRRDGETLAGHLDSATVFAGEVCVTELTTTLDREHDPTTDLDLWL